MKRHPIVQPLWCSQAHPCAVSFPADLSLDVKAGVAKHAAATIELRKGETLVHTGMPFHHVYLVTAGAFKSVQLGEDGQSQVTSFHWPREFMGLGGFSRHVHTTDLVALTTPALVCEFPVHPLDSRATVAPPLLALLLEYVSEGLAQAEYDQFMLGSLTAAQKIASFLLQTQDKLRRAGMNPDVFALPLTREDIGSYLGLTMETVSRLLTQLRTHGVAEVDKKLVRILRDDVLRAWRTEGGESLPDHRAGPPAGTTGREFRKDAA